MHLHRIPIRIVYRLIPSIITQIIGVNPYEEMGNDDAILNADYLLVRLPNVIETEEKIKLFEKIFREVFSAILLSQGYLPGPTLVNTFAQVNKMTRNLKAFGKGKAIISEGMLHYFGNSITIFKEIQKDYSLYPESEGMLISTACDLIKLLKDLRERVEVDALLILSDEGLEIFARYGTDPASIYSVDLIAPTVTGIRALLSELTMGREVQKIEHEDRVFLLSRRESFRAIFMVKKSSLWLEREVARFTSDVNRKLGARLSKFNGFVDEFEQPIMEMSERFFT